MFLKQRFYLLDSLRVLLLEHLISDGSREHMAGDVPSQSGDRQYGKRDKHQGCD
jgi:hypothetical protein